MALAAPVSLKVCAALLVRGETVLLARRPEGKAHAGKWEFPGGKIERDETAKEAVVREVKEELDISLKNNDVHHFLVSSHQYSESFKVELVSFLCLEYRGAIQALEGQQFKWIRIADLLTENLLEADVYIAQCLLDWFSKSSENISS